jgi:hypothetical protein
MLVDSHSAVTVTKRVLYGTVAQAIKRQKIQPLIKLLPRNFPGGNRHVLIWKRTALDIMRDDLCRHDINTLRFND